MIKPAQLYKEEIISYINTIKRDKNRMIKIRQFMNINKVKNELIKLDDLIKLY